MNIITLSRLQHLYYHLLQSTIALLIIFTVLFLIYCFIMGGL